VTILLFVAGLVALVMGAEWLVRGASNLALRFGISPLVVGLTVVAFGTSAPEVAVSVGAAIDGRSGVAVGNVVGSNVFNILFILGVSALLTPLAVSRQVVRQEVPVLVGVTLLVMAFGFDAKLVRVEGVVLLSLLVAYTVFLVVQSRRDAATAKEPAASELDFAPAAPHVAPRASVGKQLGLIVLGLAGLVLGATWVVDGATTFARALGVSDTVIGLTIVAAGTSLPEVATSITAALRGQRDIAVGNVVGSNAFNLFGCLGAAAIAAPAGVEVPLEVMQRDAWVMLAATVACVPVFRTGHQVSRLEGGLFVAGYVAYTAVLIHAASGG
jgi:cation:H+ antiporter